jgi:hypothetical protein
LNQFEPQGGPRLASLFLVDRWGTCVADAYTNQFADRSAGRNFSWRSYFHGGPRDLPRTRPRTPPPQIGQTYLSAVYKSSVTERWKIAISTPLRDAADPDRPLAGVMALTIDLGDFAIFRSREESIEYFAVLIDHRPGERFGTILQHPLFRQQPPDRDFQVTPQQLAQVQSARDHRYQDPLAAAPGGGAFAGDWIAAWEPVVLPGRGRSPGQRDPTDLLVLVQVRASVANAPVNRLGQRLAFDGLVALTLVVLAVGALWLLAFRLPPGQIRGWVARSSASGWTATAQLPTVRTPPPPD